MTRSIAGWWNDRSLRGKGIVVVALPLVMLFGITALFLASVRAADRESRAFEQASSVSEAADDILQDVLTAEASVDGYVLTGNKNLLVPYKRALWKLAVDRERLRTLLPDEPEHQANARQMDALVDLRLGQLVILLDRQALEGALPASPNQVTAGIGTSDELRSLVTSIDEHHREEVRTAEAERERATGLAQAAAVVGIVVAVVGGILGSVVFTRSIVRRVRRNRENAELLIAGEPLKPAPKGRDEIGRSGAALVEAAEQIRAAEREIREHRALLQAILDQMGEGVVVADVDGRFPVFNPAAGSILGLGATDTPPEQWSERYGLFIPDGRVPFPADKLPLVLAMQGISTDDMAIMVENAARPERRFVSMSGRPLRAADGSSPGGLVVFRDITADREAGLRLSEYRRDLEHSNEELERFAYVASHDLQEPLRMVASHVQLLAGDLQGTLPPDAEESMAFAVDGAKRMQRLINDLLTYSRVGRRGKPLEPTALSEVLDTALLNLQVALAEQGAEVTTDDLPVVNVDAGQMVQLLQNLIGNAIKFRRKEEPPRIHVSAEAGEGAWSFAVRDNGIGIPHDQVERVFQIFQRLHSRAEYEGTGIGLAVCRRIVERHGGRIWIEPAPGGGSHVRFTIASATAEIAA